MEGDKAKSSKQTLSNAVNIKMPVTRIYHMMKNQTNKRISTKAAVYLAAAAEKLILETMIKSVEQKPANRKRITTRDILMAMDKYPSLAAVFPNSLIVIDAGADPQEAADLTTKKKRKHDDEKKKSKSKKHSSSSSSSSDDEKHHKHKKGKRHIRREKESRKGKKHHKKTRK